jgi:hypothetical protein
MLVCSVSLRPRHAGAAGIAASVVEAASAVDATATGNVVFATLVDDPANVIDRVDAYLGEIMLEAASVSDTFDAGLNYSAAIDEATIAADLSDASVSAVLSATVSEAATATEVQDATITALARSAMIPEAFVNASTSREANVAGTMVNL